MKRQKVIPSQPGSPNIDGALAALNAEDLRDLIRDIIPLLGDKTLSQFNNALIERAARGKTGWQPSGPTDEGVADALAFAKAAKRVGYADPSEVDNYLRQGSNAFQAWCRALMEAGDWKAALAANEEAAEIVIDKTYSAGDFLDGAALAAQELGRKDLPERLELAWRKAPSMLRLRRWLGSSGSKGVLKNRAAAAIEACPRKAHRQKAFLHVVLGDFETAAKLLASAPGLGWR